MRSRAFSMKRIALKKRYVVAIRDVHKKQKKYHADLHVI
jgi:hypothetical protein